jgi:hypothetical protein
MNHRKLNTALLILCAFSVQSALASHEAASSSSVQEASRNLFELLHSDEVKSIAKFLGQKDINHLLASSRRCNSDVRGGNLTTFTEGRVDTLKIDTPEKLNDFLTRKTDHLYAGIQLEVSIHNEEELRRFLSHKKLHRSLTELTLKYVYPFDSDAMVETNAIRLALAEMLTPFQKIRSVIVKGNSLPVAFNLLRENKVEELNKLIQNNSKHLIIKNSVGETLAHLAAKFGNLEFLQFLFELVPQIIHERGSGSETPLVGAVRMGHLPVVQFLEEKIPKGIMEKNSAGIPTVHFAAIWRRWPVLRFIAESYPTSLNITNGEGKTVLDIAVERDAPQDVISELCRLGARTGIELRSE